jgi:hypothetical protein
MLVSFKTSHFDLVPARFCRRLPRNRTAVGTEAW